MESRMTEQATRPDLRVEVIQSEAAFDNIRIEWNALAARVSRSVFLQHEWLSAAWAWRRMDSTLYIPCVYAGDTLVAALPMVRPLKTSRGGRVFRFLSV